ncbi:MAG: long-subunit fatty acid transport protein [Arenicella sp.]|jgi:long-subunit fatty acid transport protein
MLSTKSVLPNFLKTLLVASMAFGSVAAFAGHHQEGEKKIGGLKDIKSKHSLEADKAHNELDTDALKSSMTDESAGAMNESDKMIDDAEKKAPEE